MPAPKKFWMVYSPQGHAPTYKHWSRESADTEAVRLAKMNPGRQFFVLKAMAGFEAEEPAVKQVSLRHPDDQIPF